MNWRLTKTFGFGRKDKATGGQGGPGGPGGGGHRGGPLYGGGGPMMMSSNSDRRYNLTLGISVRNAFNNVNVASPGRVLGQDISEFRTRCKGPVFSWFGREPAS